ncbi:MAG TPA: primosomal protein N', partial [Chitinophagaceae bacterium]|nr:primosomal protein N' [Chitinophagaceae bacterium]
IMLSPPLIDEIQSVINKGKQVILFQNRRGYTPYQVCNVCGWIPKCKFCDVSLTFHKFNNKLLCHYCGTIYSPVHSCAACGSDQFVQRNFGTEKIEEQLQEVFPDAHIARMDMDTVRGKNAHDVLIQRFEQHKIDILVGTQMVVKGLDFDHVDLVGILDADALMQFADFRVNERAFQLMEQVSGRAGRKNEKGKVVIQTLQPEHPLLQMVQQHDYQQMFTAELANRNEFGYPPLTKLIKLTFRHRQKPVVVQAAMVYAESLKKKYGKNIVGPAEPVIGRVRNLYLMELLVKMPRDNKVITRCKKDLQEQIALLHQQKNFRSVMVIADVDPI